jgi:hypothetical protein
MQLSSGIKPRNNQPANNLPNMMMTRWLAYIPLFDFTPKHIHSHKNRVADGLSWRGHAPADDMEDKDIDNFFDAQLYTIRYMSFPPALIPCIYWNEAEY